MLLTWLLDNTLSGYNGVRVDRSCWVPIQSCADDIAILGFGFEAIQHISKQWISWSVMATCQEVQGLRKEDSADSVHRKKYTIFYPKNGVCVAF